MKPTVSLSRLAWKSGLLTAGERTTPEEMPVAIVHDGATAAVMMATPADLEDFAIGFSLSEGFIDSAGDIRSLEIVEQDLGVEARLWLNAPASARHSARRRAMIGPTGCGLCGIDSLAEAAKPPRNLSDRSASVAPDVLLAALAGLERRQVLGQATRAIHAAALCMDGEIVLVREDVGRHNALDKLIGTCAASGRSADGGVLLLTSRVSVEMVQKAAVLGAPIVCAMSAPTALAVRTAEQAGLTLVAVARADGFEVFTRPDRIWPDRVAVATPGMAAVARQQPPA